MQRYFIPAGQVKDEKIWITGNDAHHIKNVLRMQPGGRVMCVAGNEAYVAEIESVALDEVICEIKETLQEEKELPVSVTIVSGLPKGDKLEYIVQKGTELGANAFIPYMAERSIVKWDPKKSAKKVERLQKIAKEAAEQSHRLVIPAVEEPVSHKALLAKAKEYDVLLVAYEEDAKQEERSAFSKCLQELEAGASVLMVFGPEGGLTEAEIADFHQAGFISCGLGPRILRTETAPLYALAAVSYQLELMR